MIINKFSNLTIEDIEEKDGITLQSFNDQKYPLDLWYQGVRNSKICELSDTDIARFVRQNLYLIYILPEVLSRISQNPFTGDIYSGELIASLVKIGDDFWFSNTILMKETKDLIDSFNKNQLMNSFEWLYEGEEDEYLNRVLIIQEKLSRLSNIDTK